MLGSYLSLSPVRVMQLMKAIIAQMKRYNNEKERNMHKKLKEMNASDMLEGRKGNVGDVSNKIDLVMAANTKESKENNNNNNESCVDNNDITKKGAEIMHNIDIEENVEQGRWYNVVKEDNLKMPTNKYNVDNKSCINKLSNEYNKWEGRISA